MNTYYYEMSDGAKDSIYTANAGVAIKSALSKYLGRTVKRCWAGQEGRAEIRFEVPCHLPVVECSQYMQPKQEAEAFDFLATTPEKKRSPREPG